MCLKMADTRDSLIVQYFNEGLTYQQIRFVLCDQLGIYISLRHLKRVLRGLMLMRRMYSDSRTVVDFISNELEHSGPLHGYRVMRQRCIANGLRVRVNDVATILRICDPRGVEARTARRFQRRNYFAAGPNFVWHLDGYDKLKPYGLCIHGCICGFSRKIIWLNVYHTNNNPRIIAGYLFEALNEYSGTPRIIRGDFGTENVVVREIQRHLRGDENAYISGSSTLNQRIESWWGYLRRQHIQYWMDTLKNLQNTGEFSGSDSDKCLVQFCFMALLQTELSLAARMWNNHTIRRSRNQHVPFGQPNRMHDFPGLWNTENYLWPVSRDAIVALRDRVEFRSTVCCAPNVYDVCIDVMAEDRFLPPKTVDEAVRLFQHLKRRINVIHL